MSQIFPVILLAVGTIAIAYILELLAVLFGGVGVFVEGLPDWSWTVVLLIATIVTYRALPE